MLTALRCLILGLILGCWSPLELLAINNCRVKVRHGKHLVLDARLPEQGQELKFDEKAFSCLAKPAKHHNQEILCKDTRSKVSYGIVLQRYHKKLQGLASILVMQTAEKEYYLQAWCD